MSSSEGAGTSAPTGRLSLIIPWPADKGHTNGEVAEYRRILEDHAGFDSVEVIIARAAGRSGDGLVGEQGTGPDWIDSAERHLVVEGREWASLARAGLGAATGDHLIVLDVERHYSPESLRFVISPVQAGESDLAVAIPRRDGVRFAPWSMATLGFSLASRTLLGTSDVFSGLLALRRSLWDAVRAQGVSRGPNLILDLLVRQPVRSVDVPVAVGERFRAQRVGFKDIRLVKHLLDGRFGTLSRLVQFCIVGASGMVVDLSFYALFQWIFSVTGLIPRVSTFFGFPSNLAVARASAIAIALVWNFALNRRLTFNDARRGAWLRQFFTYALSNALAVVVSFTLSLYLPAHIGFFAQHKLAAAVVGIVASTGISFSMSRWIVFSRRSAPTRVKRPPAPQSVLEPSTIP